MLSMISDWLDERRRQRDRRELWPEFQFYMQDRDHAIAAMSMHMLMSQHWCPVDMYGETELPFLEVLEMCIEETMDWGSVGAHVYNMPFYTDEVPDKPGLLRSSDESV